METMNKFKARIVKEVERLTAMNVLDMKLVVKSVHYENK